jgi:hypothetical protein
MGRLRGVCTLDVALGWGGKQAVTPRRQCGGVFSEVVFRRGADWLSSSIGSAPGAVGAGRAQSQEPLPCGPGWLPLMERMLAWRLAHRRVPWAMPWLVVRATISAAGRGPSDRRSSKTSRARVARGPRKARLGPQGFGWWLGLPMPVRGCAGWRRGVRMGVGRGCS